MSGHAVTPAGPTGAPARYDVVEQDRLPRLGGLFAKGAARSVGMRPKGAVRLPEVAYQVTDADTTVEAARLAAYLRLLGEPSSEVLPAGFLHVLGFPLATAVLVRSDFPLPLLGMVHLRNMACVLRPVRLGETITMRAWAQDAHAHRRGVQVDVVAEVLAGGEPAYRGVSTYLAKGFRAPDGAVPAAETPREHWTAPLPTARWALGGGTGRAYGAVSGDRNPIHMSGLGAKAFGFPRAIAHGMYTAARALAEVGPARRGEAYEWTVEFLKPVLLPGTVDVAIRYAAEAVPGSAGGAGTEGFVYDGWRSGTDARHFRGTVTPL